MNYICEYFNSYQIDQTNVLNSYTTKYDSFTRTYKGAPKD